MALHTALLVFISLVVVQYLILIVLFIIGWTKLRYHKYPRPKSFPFISVVIAFRNESQHLPDLLMHLDTQAYPPDRFEIILSDDFSEDQSRAIIRNFIATKPGFRLLESCPGDSQGKKEALKRAIALAKGDVIVTTDADCTMGKQWIKQISDKFGQDDIRLVIGPVALRYDDGSVFSMLQTLEFMSLTGSTGGSAGTGHPIMCNGANLAVRASTLSECINDIKGQGYASGDDMFLLQAIQKRFPGKTAFLKNREAIVKTIPVKNLKAFFQQRARWAGKSLGYTDVFTVATGITVLLTNCLIVLTTVAGIVYTPLLWVAMVILGIKSIVDFILIAMVARFQNATNLLVLFPLMALLYPFYAIATVLHSALFNKAWKGRIIDQ
jgi:poly-beta-1,6-N-acetyl-D-glucosamine synthase